MKLPWQTAGVRVMTYHDLDVSRVQKQFQKVKAALERDDFRSPDVKKLAVAPYYRAKLDDTNRLLLTFVTYGSQTVCLVLDVIHQHRYDQCRFLRGAVIDEEKLLKGEGESTPENVGSAAPPVRYLHPERREFHLLDKVLSFDDAQQEVYQQAPPLIVVGSAGSGKTALTLQKLREMPGQVLYVTHSAYLAQSARQLYAAFGFENEQQEVQFLSFREFLNTVRVPAGREVDFAAFRDWFARQPRQQGGDAHQLFEEFRGVLSSAPEGPLSQETYLALGVRQSIFPAAERPQVYALFARYQAWLRESRLFDSSTVASSYLNETSPRFDFVVVDEVQDLTAAQLALILRSLRTPGQFLLCGDSNQIVHPNFFSWSAVKSLLWRDPQLAERQQISVLRANFRNAGQVTRVANDLLRVKHARFGSVDRESNFLVQAAATDPGSVTFLLDSEGARRQLDSQTRESTDYAVLVLRDEDKAAARRAFGTPLVFSVHEAKGLEYPNILLLNFISGQRQTYAEITEGVTPADLVARSETGSGTGELRYSRARDKSDKSLEVYKFYVNALYVAITRAVGRVILLESDTRHPLLGLLGIPAGDQAEQLKVRRAGREDWEREARKLELQGKREQAGDIRRRILQQKPVPWEVWTPETLRRMELDVRANPGGSRQLRPLLDFALLHHQEQLLQELQGLKVKPAASYLRNTPKDRQLQRQAVVDKYRRAYEAGNVKAVMADCDRYGADHRTPENLTPLMLAALTGQSALAGLLLERGADVTQTDASGRTPYLLALGQAVQDREYARTRLGPLAELLRPAALDVLIGDRLVRLAPDGAEFHFLSVMLALWPDLPKDLSGLPLGHFALEKRRAGFTAEMLETHQDVLPISVLREGRRKRSYTNHVLARAEVDSKYLPSRQLWKRVRQGVYQPNPEMSVPLRMTASGEQEWVNVALLGDPIARAWMQAAEVAATIRS